MHDMNRMQLVGEICHEPDLSRTKNGIAKLRVTVEVNRRERARGEWRAVTERFTVLIWNNRAEALARLVARGTRIMVEGPIRFRTYTDRVGLSRHVHEVTAENIFLLKPSKRSEADYSGQPDCAEEPIGEQEGASGG